MFLQKSGLALFVAGAIGQFGYADIAGAAPYTGTAPPCPVVSGPCSVDLMDFMKSKFHYKVTRNGVTSTYTSDSTNPGSSANSSAATSGFVANTEGFAYEKTLNPNDPTKVIFSPAASKSVGARMGFMNHPTQSNVVMMSKTNELDQASELFRWDSATDNSVYVQAHPSTVKSTHKWMSFGTELNPVSSDDGVRHGNWRNRGFYWYDKKFDMTTNDGIVWTSPLRPFQHEYFYLFDSSGDLVADRQARGNDKYLVQVKYYKDTSHPAVKAVFDHNKTYGPHSGELPNSLELLEVLMAQVYAPATTVDRSTVIWFEKYHYARQKVAVDALHPDGYNYFGIVRWAAAGGTTYEPWAGYCSLVNGVRVPPSGFEGWPCGDFDMVLSYDSPSNLLRNSAADFEPYGYTVDTWFKNSYAGDNRYISNVQISKRAPAAVESVSLPHNRGGFAPPGNGVDANGTAVTGTLSNSVQAGDMVFLQNNLTEQDWYVYTAGTDPLAIGGTCRQGYQLIGALNVLRSYNGLTGNYYSSLNTGAKSHSVTFCGTSTDLYLHASNYGEDACVSGYASRSEFATPEHLGSTSCRPGSACVKTTEKDRVNFCVKASEFTNSVYARIGSDTDGKKGGKKVIRSPRDLSENIYAGHGAGR